MRKGLFILCLFGVVSCHSNKTIVDTSVKTKTETIVQQAETKDSISTNTTNERSEINTENNSIFLEGVKFDSTGKIKYADKAVINVIKTQENKEKQSVVETKTSTKDTLSISQKIINKEEKKTIEKSNPEPQSWKFWVFLTGLLILAGFLIFLKTKF